MTAPSPYPPVIDPRQILDGLTVVVPTLGRPVLERCLQALANGPPARLVVVDQGEPGRIDPWLDRLDGWTIERLRVAPQGAAAARNLGIAAVEGRWFVAIDDDCLAAPGWLEAMAARLAKHPGAVITGRVKAPEGMEAPSTTDELYRRPGRTVVFRRPVWRFDPLCTGNMGCAVELFHRVGPFDGHPLLRFAAEDNDWAHRALSAGVPIVFAPEAVVEHVDWREPGERAALERRYARGQGAFYGKYLRRGQPHMMLRAVYDMTRGVVRWGRGLLGRDPLRRASGRAWAGDLLLGLWAGLRGPW